MLRFTFCLLLAACETASPCATVRCGGGNVCSDEDGACHCGDGPACGATETCEAAACVPTIPEPVCGDGTSWAPGEEAFVERTEEWGLTGIEGVRMTVTDVDGDGWADLEVRRGAPGNDDFDGTRFTWILRNTGDGAFEDITEASGFLARRSGEGGRAVSIVAWGDVDNDGDLDAYTALPTETPIGDDTSELLLNDGEGGFTLSSDQNGARRADFIDIPAGASFTDFDRDGQLDLWVPQHNASTATGIRPTQSILFRGDGSGMFTDVTADLGLTTLRWGSDYDIMNEGRAHSRAWSAAACDLNDDGWPELLAASYGRAPNHLFQARPSADGVTYENRSVASGYAYDDDLTWDDNQFARCFCAANRTAEDCADVEAPLVSCSPNWSHDSDRQPFRLGGNSGATICADIDNDGDIDLLTTEIKHWWAGSGADGSEVLINDGADDPVFSRPGDAALGLAIEHEDVAWDEGHMTAAIFDFDLDGRQDIYIGGSDYAGNRGLLYQQEDTLEFREVPPGDGIDHNRSHGVVVADFDRDGDLDVVVGHSRARCDATLPNDCYATSQIRFFENVAGDGGNFVQLALTAGEGANRAAIGARVRVTAGGVTQTQDIGGGHGHYGAQNDRVLTFGLGSACEAQIEIRWPDAAGTTETFTLPAGHRFAITQGQRPAVAP